MCCNNMTDQYSFLSRDWGSSYALMCNNWADYIHGREDNHAAQAAFATNSRIACICECHETLSPLPTSYYNTDSKTKSLSHNNNNDNNNNNSNNTSTTTTTNNNNNLSKKNLSRSVNKSRFTDEGECSRSHSVGDPTVPMKNQDS